VAATPARRPNGLAAVAAPRCPRRLAFTLVVRPHSGQGTQVVVRSGHGRPGSPGRWGSRTPSPRLLIAGAIGVAADTGEPVGAGLGVVRWLVHLVLGFLCGIPAIIDYLFPLWDLKKQTIADKPVSSVVTVVPQQPFSIVPPVAPAQPM